MDTFSEFHHWIFEKPYSYMSELLWFYEKKSHSNAPRVFAKQSLLCAQVTLQKSLILCSPYDQDYWNKNIPKFSTTSKKVLKLQDIYRYNILSCSLI